MPPEQNCTSSVNRSSDERCTYDVNCDQSATNYCQECEQNHCLGHYSEHMTNTQDVLTEKLKSLLSQLSANEILDSIKRIHLSNLESNENGETIDVLQEQLLALIRKDAQNTRNRSSTASCQFEFYRQSSVENDIDRLRKDIGEMKSILAEIENSTRRRASAEQLDHHNPPKTERSVGHPSIETMTHQIDSSTTLSHFPFEQSMSDIEEEDDDDDEINDSGVPSRISQKIQLSNNIVRWLRGPVKIMFNGTMHVFDVFAQGTHISRSIIQAVKCGYKKQPTLNNSLKPALAEITSDWIFISANLDQGFNSPSIWMRDPQHRRILVKTQGHPLCAANEWLAYVLGKRMDLSVNEVQISIYENNLVTLHTDVAQENERTVTFMELRKQTRKTLLTDATMGCMDLLDHIIQNVDRNQRNILITMPNSSVITEDDPSKMKIHLIDHASCFGMGKLSVISLIACKFHTSHLSIVKFDPMDEARKFERYLARLPVLDRRLIRKPLNRFATISNEQFDSWLHEVRDLLSSSQYSRIRDVLYQQRDIAKRYATQWGTSLAKSTETNRISSSINPTVTYF